MTDFQIRRMEPAEIDLALDWAAAEGWNPGLADALPFAAADPDGFLVGELDGVPAATISCVRYDAHFAFIGLFIVRKDVRGRGYGHRMLDRALAHAGSRVIGLDGVVEQQHTYKSLGFSLAYKNVRYGGRVAALAPSEAGTLPLADVPLATLVADDATVFPVARPAFLKAWIHAPGHKGRALVRDGRLSAWGVIRPCRTGAKIGPLVADDRAGAEAVLASLLAVSGADEIFLDIPSVNWTAVALAEDLGLVPVFETARMYRGAVGDLRLERAYCVATYELG